MIIRQRQMDEIAVTTRKPFIRELEKHVRARYPERTWATSSERVQDDLDFLIQEACRFEITIETDVVRFVDLNYQVGHCFYREENFSWADQILTSNDYSGTEKVDRIFAVIHGFTLDNQR